MGHENVNVHTFMKRALALSCDVIDSANYAISYSSGEQTERGAPRRVHVVHTHVSRLLLSR
jgi:hypothetical protein